MSFRAPARLLAGRIPAPVQPELVRGQAVVSLCLGAGRCLKPAGTGPLLASEFRIAELVTPVRWQAACRPALKGLFTLRLFTDSAGVARLVQTALEFPVELSRHQQGVEGAAYACSLSGRTAAEPDAQVAIPRPIVEGEWSHESLFNSPEDAEISLLHPEYIFVPETSGRAVRAVPVHQYARSTTVVAPISAAAPLVAHTLGAQPEELVLDHVLYQKRCTHTWSFPPERIVTTTAPTVARARRLPMREPAFPALLVA
jgi:hypothetical protein